MQLGKCQMKEMHQARDAGRGGAAVPPPAMPSSGAPVPQHLHVLTNPEPHHLRVLWRFPYVGMIDYIIGQWRLCSPSPLGG